MAKKASIWKKVFAVLFLTGLMVGGYSGWKWLNTVKLVSVQMQGLVNSSEGEIRELIRVDTGMVLFDIDADVLEDRIRRHPWIMEAFVSRLPTGMLDIRVIERHPVVQVLTSEGELHHYLDRNGFWLPMTKSNWYPVPILTGNLETFNPVMPLTDEVVREMLFELPEISPNADVLISELERVESGFKVRTTPTGLHESIPVWMGSSDFRSRFQLLQAFWEQEVSLRQDLEFASIDLRFNSQVVTKQQPRQLELNISN